MNLLVTICVKVFYVPCEKEQHATNKSIFGGNYSFKWPLYHYFDLHLTVITFILYSNSCRVFQQVVGVVLFESMASVLLVLYYCYLIVLLL